MRFRPLLLLAVLPLATATAQVDNPDYRTLINHLSGIEGVNSRPLLATAEASEAAFMRGNRCAALGAIRALGNQLSARFVDNPDFIDNPNIRAALNDIRGITAILMVDPGDRQPKCIDNPNI